MAISLIVLSIYVGLALLAPPEVGFAVLVLGFAPIILISLFYGWQIGALSGMLVPLISASAALLHNDPTFDAGKRLVGIISAGILGAVIGLIRNQWLNMLNAEQALDERIAEETWVLQQQNEYLKALHDTTLALINHLELHTLLQLILSRACQISGTPHGFVDLVLPDQSGARQELGMGEFAHLNGVITPKGVGLTGRVLASGQAMQVEDYPTWEHHIPAYQFGVHAIVCFPLRGRDETIGVLGLAYAEKGRLFTPKQIEQLEQFSHLGALAYENARLYHAVQEELRKREQAEHDVRLLNEALEQRVLERTAQLEYANRELQGFSYAISHDLRPPLRAIDGYSRIVIEQEKENISAESLELLNKVRHYAHRMDRLINDMLNFTRLGRHSLRRAPTPVREDILQAFEQARAEFNNTDNIQFILHDIPETIYADPALLHIIFTHLFNNAIKFSRHTPAPRIEIGCEIMNNTPTFYVRDNGIGFDMKYAQKIFSVFERLHTSDEFDGTGAGLAIVQRAIQLHEGRIWVNAAPEQGATFYFTLGDIQHADHTP